MATPPKAHQLNKAIVAYLDGRREKGYIYDFSSLKPSFRILPEEDPLQQRGKEVAVKDLKAVFFVKDFVGNSEYTESQILISQNGGRKAEVTFRDGEKLIGTTDAYNPQKIGFFLVPADPRSNNLRIFVITKNATQIRWI